MDEEEYLRILKKKYYMIEHLPAYEQDKKKAYLSRTKDNSDYVNKRKRRKS